MFECPCLTEFIKTPNIINTELDYSYSLPPFPCCRIWKIKTRYISCKYPTLRIDSLNVHVYISMIECPCLIRRIVKTQNQVKLVNMIHEEKENSSTIFSSCTFSGNVNISITKWIGPSCIVNCICNVML